MLPVTPNPTLLVTAAMAGIRIIGSRAAECAPARRIGEIEEAYISKMEYESAKKMKEILPFSASCARESQYGRRSFEDVLSSGSRHCPGDMWEPVQAFSKKLRWIRFLGADILKLRENDSGIGRKGGQSRNQIEVKIDVLHFVV